MHSEPHKRKLETVIETRAHLHYGICRQCWGTGEVTREEIGRVICRDCMGEGALP